MHLLFESQFLLAYSHDAVVALVRTHDNILHGIVWQSGAV
jgi:hypothetical protein